MATDKLNAMRIFRRVAELGSFVRAADDLDISAASVSKHVAFLEKDLATRLITRTTRRMHLTEAGRVFLNRTQAMLDALEDAELEARGMQDEPRGTLRINVPVSFGLSHITPCVDGFLNRYPDIKIDIQLSDHLIDLVEQGVDLAIRVRSSLPDSTMVAKRLRTSRNVVCASPEYLAKHAAIQHPEDLKQHNCLLFSLHEQPRIWTLGEHEITVAGNYSADSSLAIRQSLLNGMGIGLVPRFLVQSDISQQRLIPLLEDYPASPYSVYAVMPAGRKPAAKVRLFLDYLDKSLGEQVYWE